MGWDGRGEGAMTELTFSVSDYGDDNFDDDDDNDVDDDDDCDEEEGGECNDLIDFFCFLARDHAAAGFFHIATRYNEIYQKHFK